MSHLNSQSPPPQNLQNPIETSSSQQIIQLPKHPKIKPILHRHSADNTINEPNLQRKLKFSSKTSKAIKATPNYSTLHSTKYVKGVFKSLKVQSSLSKLEYSFPNIPFFENDYLFSKLRDLSSLTSIQLGIMGLYPFKISFKVLLKSLTSLKNLNHLDIAFHVFPSKERNIPKFLALLLHRLRRIKYLSLDFNICYDLKEDFQNIVLNLKRLTHLQSLQLDFRKTMEYSDQNTITNLALIIPKLEKLAKISLEFSGDFVTTGSDIIDLFRSFQNLKQLSDLTLNLLWILITNQGSAKLLSQGLAFLDASLIKKLKLVPPRTFGDQSVIQTSRALQRFTLLNHIDFNLSENSLGSSQWVPELGLVLKDMEFLSSLSLGVSFVRKDTPDLGSLIRPLESLTDLKINFAGKYPPEDLPIDQLAEGLRTLKSLKILHIHFPQQNSVPDETFGALTEALKEMILLRDLSIKFASVDLLTEWKAESLSVSLKKLENLSDLCLDFGVINKIDDKALVKILQTLRNLPLLSSLELGLQQTSRIEDKEEIYEILFGVLKEKKNIRQVILHLDYSEFNLKEIRDLEKVKDLKTNWR